MARYIDADREIRGLKAALGRVEHNETTKFVVDEVIKLLQTAPTADVVEVKHNRWENISGFDVCNICGTSPAYCEPKPNNPKGYPPYCHNCGAKMDGGKAE